MKISGLQKLTLLNYPGQMSATIFLCGCNLRCPFCQNVDLVYNTSNAPTIDEEEIMDYLKERYGKLKGVCITGGEPLINDDIEDIILKIKNIGYKIKIDTNGYFPDRLNDLIKKGIIDMVAMDIKTGFTNYDIVIGKSKNDIINKNIEGVDFEKLYNEDKNKDREIYKSIDIIRNSNIDYEFRTTCVKGLHSKYDFYEIREMIRGAKKYFLQNYQKNDLIANLPFKSFEKSELEEFLYIVKDYVERVEIRGI